MFVKKNLNPRGHKTGDCVIRAVAAATGLSWDNTYQALSKAGFELKVEMSEVEAVDLVLKSLGFLEGKIKVVKGSKRPTVKSFSEQNPNLVAVLRVANHMVACAYGNYVDIWDSGDCSVYKYWYKEVNK